jgi:hypothetical protein
VIHEGELADFARVDGWPAGRAAVAVRRAVERCERGDRLFTLVGDGGLVGYGWLASAAVGADSSGDGVTTLAWELLRRDRPAHRGFAPFVAFMLRRAFADGAQTVLIRCDARDEAGRAAMEWLQLPARATIRSLRILGWRRTLESRRTAPEAAGGSRPRT